MNHALCLWEASWESSAEEVDYFIFRLGPDPVNHTDVASSELIDMMTKYWGRNMVSLSNVDDPTTISYLGDGITHGYPYGMGD